MLTVNFSILNGPDNNQCIRRSLKLNHSDNSLTKHPRFVCRDPYNLLKISSKLIKSLKARHSIPIQPKYTFLHKFLVQPQKETPSAFVVVKSLQGRGVSFFIFI